jgi:hypothetical protein
MGGFLVTERGGDLYINPKSYDRYTGVAEAVVSIDPAGSARLYGILKPRIEEAYRELGELEPNFDRTLERAIVRLLSTPVPDDPIAVEPKGIGYRFADDKLESLAPAQKELLRMGPENARAIQRQELKTGPREGSSISTRASGPDAARVRGPGRRSRAPVKD